MQAAKAETILHRHKSAMRDIDEGNALQTSMHMYLVRLKAQIFVLFHNVTLLPYLHY